jgi:hypothetical protein
MAKLNLSQVEPNWVGNRTDRQTDRHYYPIRALRSNRQNGEKNFVINFIFNRILLQFCVLITYYLGAGNTFF